jgi:hypothetical protein
MRLMIPQDKGTDGRDQGSNCSEEDVGEEEVRRLTEVEEVPAEEIESEGEGENLLAFNSVINVNNVPSLTCDQGAVFINGMEEHKDNSNYSLNVIINDNLNSGGGVVELAGGCSKVDRLVETDGLELGQGGGVGGPNLSINSIQAVKGGANSKEPNSGNLGRSIKPKCLEGDAAREKEKRKGGVYSNGPSGFYRLLNKSPTKADSSSQQIGTMTKKGKATFPYIPPSASLRRQHLMAKSLSNRSAYSHSHSVSVSVPSPAFLSCPVGGAAEGCSQLEGGVTWGPVLPNQATSVAGSLGSCSIHSADIRNCNNRFLKNLEQEVVSKVWKGAQDLGVVCKPLGDRGEAI